MTARRPLRLLAVVPAILLGGTLAHAHVGSPDVFLDATAGPYRLLITVRPPVVIPGVAEVEILSLSGQVREVRVVPTPMSGAGAKFAPAPEVAKPSRDSPTRFAADLWMMTPGAWEVRVTADGPDGTGTVAVPVPTLPQSTLAMGRGLGALLFGLMILLATGFVSILSALARESTLGPAEAVTPRSRRRGRIVGVIATAGVVALLAFGRWWWNAEASAYADIVYKPLELRATEVDGHTLSLTLADPGWIELRRLDDLVPDHGHLMHLFVLSPDLDRLWHLHPRQLAPGEFVQPLPADAAGSYDVFADIVHASGISETATGQVTIAASLPGAPPAPGEPLDPDDAVWAGDARSGSHTATLSDGARLVWERGTLPLRARELRPFTFRVEDAAGAPVPDLELYMGMPGHAVFVRRDRQVFAHVHPSGSAPMAALEMSQRTPDGSAPHAAHHAPAATALPATISFPYGMPSAGDYRIFVQVKRQGRVLTAAFDAHVE